jgi:hypothetical protein
MLLGPQQLLLLELDAELWSAEKKLQFLIS